MSPHRLIGNRGIARSRNPNLFHARVVFRDVLHVHPPRDFILGKRIPDASNPGALLAHRVWALRPAGNFSHRFFGLAKSARRNRPSVPETRRRQRRVRQASFVRVLVDAFFFVGGFADAVFFHRRVFLFLFLVLIFVLLRGFAMIIFIIIVVFRGGMFILRIFVLVFVFAQISSLSAASFLVRIVVLVSVLCVVSSSSSSVVVVVKIV